MRNLKGTVAGLVALVACPCHLPLTVPVLLALTGGTAVGLWLAANAWFIWLVASVLFISGLALAFTWLNQAGSAAQCELPPRRRNQGRSAPGDMTGPISEKIDVRIHTKERSHV